MQCELIRRISSFTAEHIALICENENPWRRREALGPKLRAADAEIEKLEKAVAAANAMYFGLVPKRT
jgi:hypothetical protein